MGIGFLGFRVEEFSSRLLIDACLPSLSVVEKDLDFSHMRDHLRAILAGRASLFALSSQNAMVQLMARGAPRLLENQARLARCAALALVCLSTSGECEPRLVLSKRFKSHSGLSQDVFHHPHLWWACTVT